MKKGLWSSDQRSRGLIEAYSFFIVYPKTFCKSTKFPVLMNVFNSGKRPEH